MCWLIRKQGCSGQEKQKWQSTHLTLVNQIHSGYHMCFFPSLCSSAYQKQGQIKDHDWTWWPKAWLQITQTKRNRPRVPVLVLMAEDTWQFISSTSIRIWIWEILNALASQLVEDVVGRRRCIFPSDPQKQNYPALIYIHTQGMKDAREYKDKIREHKDKNMYQVCSGDSQGKGGEEIWLQYEILVLKQAKVSFKM